MYKKALVLMGVACLGIAFAGYAYSSGCMSAISPCFMANRLARARLVLRTSAERDLEPNGSDCGNDTVGQKPE